MIDTDVNISLKALYHTFGCKLNFAETSTVARTFADAGIRPVAEGEIPDFVVINTCSVTEVADKKCRQAIRSFHRKYPDAHIVVTGCYAQLKPEQVAELDGVAVVAGIDRKDQLLQLVKQYRATHQNGIFTTPSRDIDSFTPACSRGERTRYFLKVQDGCDYWCSYCTIPRARGRSRSGTIAQMVELATNAAAEGGREIVLTGVNIGDFGHRNGETFLDLIKALDNVEGIERYRISSIEPNLLTDEVIDFCAQSQRFMPHFHVPLQSGSDEVLRLMRRRYDTAFFAEKMHRIKQAIPDAFIGVDVIVGARGETDELFEESIKFCADIPVSRYHMFVYSERPETAALQLAGKVDPRVQQQRAKRMLELSANKLRIFYESFLGTVRPVLLEHSRPGHPMGGFTDNYIKVEVDALQSLDNEVANVRLDAISEDSETVKATLV